MTRKSKFFIVVLVLGLGLVSFRQTAVADRTFEIVKNLDIFTTLFKEVNAYYVDEVNPAKLMRTGITSMLESLDPYTNYIPEDDIEDYRTMTTGEYGGIGAVVDRKNGVSTVVLPYEGYPAYKAGLKAGDQIHKINGIDLKDKSHDEISKLLKGQSNSDLILSVKRYGKSEMFDVTLKREKITIKNVPYFGMISDQIGYVKLTEFTSEAGAEVRKAVNELKAKGATKMILDLRGNPGGLLEEAVNVSNVFIGKGKEVVTTRGKLKNWTKTYNTLNDPADEQIPLVVLVSNGSASASEIVSGVMQDYDRGVLVGQRTYGKGLVQQTRSLVYNSQLKVTTGKYYIPSGRCIQAIDYSHRNPDGSVGKIADSLKSEFKTQAGRLVYDGGGVNPDIEVATSDFAPITIKLITDDLIFDFATEYYYTHPEIKSAKDFSLSVAEYNGFKTWLKDKKVNYTTQMERDIDKLIASAKAEKHYKEIEQQVLSLKAATQHNKDQDLEIYKNEILEVLEQEIAGRYFFERGMIESTFDRDQEVMEAVAVLNDPSRYQQLLKSK